MNNKIALVVSVCLLGFVTPTFAQTAKGERKARPADANAAAPKKARPADADATAPKKERPANATNQRQNVSAYDANHNGQLDPDEIETFKRDAADNKAPAAMRKFDRNRNGQLDAEELEAMKQAFQTRAAAKPTKTERPANPNRPNKPRPAKPAE